MTEASGGGSPAETERRPIQRSLEGVRVVAVEEMPDTVYLVLPSTAEGAE